MRSACLALIAAWCALMGSAAPLAAQPAPARVLRLDTADGRVDPRPAVWLLEDEAGTLRLEDVIGPAGGRFRPLGTRPLNLGYTRAAHWFHLELALSPPETTGWWLEIGYPLLDEVDLWVGAPGEPTRAVHTGDHRAFARRDVAAPTFVFRLPQDLGERVDVWLRVRSDGTVNVPLSLWRTDAFVTETARRTLGWGLYFGLVLGLALYNLFLWSVVRERMYLFYVGYLVTLSGLQGALSGYTFQYVWPALPDLATLAPGIFLPLCTSLGVLFVRAIVDVAATSPRLHRPMGVAALVPVAAMPLVLVDYSTGIRVLTAIAALVLLLLPIPVVRSYRQGYRPARYPLLALILLVPAWLLLGLRHSGVLVDDALAVYGLQLATGAEALVLSFALADRMNGLRRAEADAQARRLDAEQVALEAQRGLAQGLIAAQDAERRRIAGELHDGLGQDLLVLCNGLTRLAKHGEGDGQAAELAGMAKQAVGELRSIAHDLHPDKLDRLGLGAALRSTLAQALAAAGLEGDVAVDAGAERRLAPEARLHLYRIAQEAIANAVRHAGASSVNVSLRLVADRVLLRIADDGRGIGLETAHGLGLKSIEERARALGGRARVDSRAGQGLRLDVEVPASGAAAGAGP